MSHIFNSRFTIRNSKFEIRSSISFLLFFLLLLLGIPGVVLAEAGIASKYVGDKGIENDSTGRQIVINIWKTLLFLFFFSTTLIISLVTITPAMAIETICPGGTNPNPNVIWCDDFDNSTPINQKYFDYDNNGGDFVPVAGKGINNSTAMQVKWQIGEVGAGGFKRTFGRNPVNSQSHSTTDFKEIYWRQYLKMETGWSGNPYKLSRAMILATSNWAQAMIAHLWGAGVGDTLMIDPASGIDANNNLATTTYNDFANLKWLGYKRGITPIFSSTSSGKWYCIEVHVKLNTPGASDGVFEYWIDNNLEAKRTDLNWVGAWQDYGINAVFFENYWNGGAPGERIRYFDNIVISTQKIGCLDSTESTPSPPSSLWLY